MITTIVLIRAEPSRVPHVAQRLAGAEGVSEVYSVSGEWDLVAIVRVSEYEQIAHVVTEVFPTVEGIQRTHDPHRIPVILQAGPEAGLGHRCRVRVPRC